MKKEIIADGVYVIKNFLSEAECNKFIRRSEKIGYEEATVATSEGPKMIKGIRNNQRVTITDKVLAETFWKRIQPFVEERYEDWVPTSVNERFRFYKYDIGERFNKHRDGRVKIHDWKESRLTFMVYLNGDFEGGATEFENFSIHPEVGTALIFEHEIKHKGCRIIKGNKYVIRTDIFFEKPASDQESNITIDIEKSLKAYFSFIKDYGFSDFEYEQFGYGINYVANKDNLAIRIYVEMICSSYIWISINDYYITHLEPDNIIFKSYEEQREQLYGSLEDRRSKMEAEGSNKLWESYYAYGKTINDEYLKGISLLLRKYPNILNGDLEILKVNEKKANLEYERKETDQRKKNKIYTLRFQSVWFESDDYELFKEFVSINDIQVYLKKETHITNYKIFDWNMNEIDIGSPPGQVK
ncbi:2OG-Fe(II) oxygenase [Aquimarina sp. U1-2]|uniref:2OG-Fe(II) oxygenase n=1 Tax=Aquimarina sp. U1-2 TaxID=2823141 RepID=UPI001AED061C|nr:2OG-Fe(II) oxygenase [Aquimarina sp. U1-2]MBP2833495.1 2OG-Fe(II) oxygenase [Aquimarina sp. U1-2]